MKITNEWFKKQRACGDGYRWVFSRKSNDAKETFEALIKHNLEWANWTIARLLDRKQKIQYAIFAAEQVIGIFEKKYPDDKRPREALEAAKAVLKNNNKKTGAAAWAAAEAARAAARAAWAARDAAWAAGAAAWAARAAEAAGAAGAAAEAAGAAAWAARAAEAAGAAGAAGAAAEAAEAAVKEKIVRYGMSLLFKGATK